MSDDDNERRKSVGGSTGEEDDDKKGERASVGDVKGSSEQNREEEVEPGARNKKVNSDDLEELGPAPDANAKAVAPKLTLEGPISLVENNDFVDAKDLNVVAVAYDGNDLDDDDDNKSKKKKDPKKSSGDGQSTSTHKNENGNADRGQMAKVQTELRQKSQCEKSVEQKSKMQCGGSDRKSQKSRAQGSRKVSRRSSASKVLPTGGSVSTAPRSSMPSSTSSQAPSQSSTASKSPSCPSLANTVSTTPSKSRKLKKDSKGEKQEASVNASVKQKYKRSVKRVKKEFSKAALDRSCLKAQTKMTNLNKPVKLAASEDAYPAASTALGGLGEDVAAPAEYIDDQAILADKTHRPDLVLVKNNDNDGQLHPDGLPFWKQRLPSKELPMTDKRPLHDILKDIASKKIVLKDAPPEPDFDKWADYSELQSRDEKHFNTDQIMSNTINSMIASLDSDGLSHRKKKVRTVCTLIFTEPTKEVSYARHYHAEKDREVCDFKKTNQGLCTTKTKPTYRSAGSSSSSTSTSLSGSTSDSLKEDEGKSKRGTSCRKSKSRSKSAHKKK